MHLFTFYLFHSQLQGAIWVGNAPSKKWKKKKVPVGPCIARIRSPEDFKDSMPEGWDRSDYLVEIVPGADAAVVLALLLSYEEFEGNEEFSNEFWMQ